jgi:hypothetical protein
MTQPKERYSLILLGLVTLIIFTNSLQFYTDKSHIPAHKKKHFHPNTETVSRSSSYKSF